MSPYKEMYLKIFDTVSKTIDELQEIQKECEDIYMDKAAKEPIVIPKKDKKEKTGK